MESFQLFNKLTNLETKKTNNITEMAQMDREVRQCRWCRLRLAVKKKWLSTQMSQETLTTQASLTKSGRVFWVVKFSTQFNLTSQKLNRPYIRITCTVYWSTWFYTSSWHWVYKGHPLSTRGHSIFFANHIAGLS